MSIEEVLLEIESHRFVGREEELATLRELAVRSEEGAAVAYVFGQTGIGKTALLRAFAKEAKRDHARTVLFISVRHTEGARDVIGQIATGLGLSPDGPITFDGCDHGGGLLLLIDDYDVMSGTEAEVRERLLYRLPRGSLAVLAGRQRPSALWPLERAWRSFVTQISLAGFTRDEAERLLVSRGVEDVTARQEIRLLTGGCPARVAHVADFFASDETAAASLDGVAASQAAPREVTAFILEQMLHPGSRRRAWRPHDGGGALDRLIAAASLVPAFSRALLAEMVGRNVEADVWDELSTLSCAPEFGGWHRLESGLRERVAQIFSDEHPWLCERLQRRALRHFLAFAREARAREEFAFQQLLAMLQRGCGLPSLPAGGSIRHGIATCDLSMLRRSEFPPDLTRLAEAWPQAVVCARDAQGEILAAAVLVPSEECPDGVLPLGQGRDGEMVLAMGGKEGCCADSLLGSLAGNLRHAGGLIATVQDAYSHLLERLGFNPAAPGWWHLSFSATAFGDWIAEAGASLVQPLPAAQEEVLAKEVLQAISAGEDVTATRAAAVHFARRGETTAAGVRRWVLDALHEAEFSSSPCSLRALLRMYYVDKAGPHEQIAELLDLPRATYFRAYRQALRQLGSALLGADG